MENDISCAERLIYWYLRLNGFLLWENFVIHPDSGTNQRTDADLIGVRFLHRRDQLDKTLKDDPLVAKCSKRVNVVIAEVKRSVCQLNGPWTRPDDKNIHRVLQAIGCFPEGQIQTAASHLYERGVFEDDVASCRLVAFGDQTGELDINDVPQVLFNDVLEFIYDRLREFRRQKSSVGNWAEDGQKLRGFADTDNPEGFREKVRLHFQVG